MRILVRYFGRFSLYTDKFSEEIEMPDNAKVRDLMNYLKEKYPPSRKEVIEVSIKGRYAKEGDVLEDVASVYPIISGG